MVILKSGEQEPEPVAAKENDALNRAMACRIRLGSSAAAVELTCAWGAVQGVPEKPVFVPGPDGKSQPVLRQSTVAEACRTLRSRIVKRIMLDLGMDTVARRASEACEIALANPETPYSLIDAVLRVARAVEQVSSGMEITE